mmetsp:Transcript_20752/g.30880  ORF Transcript_20752/g.30880 Transcript_20752/m.30880 type:complete len:300 (-) Transcript_20752:32-931(-)|eukprot:CAMPEP_0201552616 /NCGR_PEP_ID=MMETSP0173_2-20130828/16816_1 /ASSEMBLY_ACC=CAM_ASM_000268 /TAXON_ID=218659 /ORGANISM="Vexillifera sp., Strain DIVA3 564/2" /LENGTH=299 /DNA_ID=CAMNT_0047963123 /DNA_START=25 /DNA_END=924 /DNA_ORIENTATION=+
MSSSSSKNQPLLGQVAIVTGASRGIGREICLTFAKAGADIVVTAKSVEEKPNLPGTIFSVAKEVEALGRKALAIQVDVRNEQMVNAMAAKTIEKFGRIDILVNNAGALWWKNVQDTPMKRYDLINEVNSRGSFVCTRAVLPHMMKQNYGKVIVCSPPINLNMLKGKVAYCISKFGMTMLAHGLAEEMKEAGKNIHINAMWPATMVESYATKNFNLGDSSMWRKASVLADCALMIVTDDVTGKAIIDEDYMRARGVTDFSQYRCDPNVEPPRITETYAEVGLVGDPSNRVGYYEKQSSKL